MRPKISVVMSVYNGSRYLRESVKSILDQTFTDFEFIIIDDGSTDNSWEILTEYATRDKRIVLIQNQENIGLTKSLNKGLKLAKGEYIARQDADDISLPHRLTKQVSLLDNQSNVVLVSCDIELINAEGCSTGKFQRACESELVSWYLLFYNHLAGHSQVMFRRKSVTNLCGYSENFRYSQDYELWCRLAEIGKIVILPEVLLQQRFHNESISNAKKLEQKVYALTQVTHNIQKLIGEEISLEEAEDLEGFWLGYWYSNCFPDNRKVKIIHLRLRQILKSFLQQRTDHDFFHPDISNRLKFLIGQQFLYWIQVPLSKQHNLLAKLKISFYAFAWNPLGIPSSWLIALWKSKSKLKILQALIRRHYKKTFNAVT